MGKVVCFYIEVSDDLDHAALERLLQENEYAYYDATAVDTLTRINKIHLEEIEAIKERK